MLSKRLAFVTLALASFALPVRADTVVLVDGRKLEGRTSEDGDEIVLKRKHGEVRFKKAEILRIEKGDDVWSELDRKQAQLGNGTADERYQLGVWCRDHTMDDEARAAFLSVLKVDPDHTGARTALGYVKDVDGRWITEEDQMRGKGLVKLDGKWMTPAEKIKAELDAAEKRQKAQDEKKKADDEAAARRHAKYEAEHQARLARIAAYEEEMARARARQRAEEDAEDRMLGNAGFYQYSGPVGPYGYFGGAPFYRYSVGPNVGYQDAIYLAGMARTGRYPRNWQPPTYRTVTVINPFWGDSCLGTGTYLDVGGLGGGFYSSSSYSSSSGPFGLGFGGYSSDSSFNSGYGSYSGYGFGVGISGSYTSRSGRSQVRFRVGF